MQSDQPKIGRFSLSLMIVAIAFCVTGTQACQENYYFARQYSGSPTPTETETGDVTESPSATSTTAKPTPSPTESGIPTNEPEETDSPFEEPTTSAIYGIFRRSVKESSTSSNNQTGKATNWLGNIASKGIDRDGDGFSDALESSLGSVADSADSVPEITLLTKLNVRMQRQDSDFDGLSNQDELLLGSDPSNPDSDGDGVFDGIEVLSGRSPVEFESRSNDSDGDGLSDEYENSIGTSSKSIDSDGDRLRDDTELIIGTDPLNPDSDGDGILDGKEVELGSDPTLPDYVFE